MYNRAEIVDHKFTSIIKENRLPGPNYSLDNALKSLHSSDLVDLFETAILTRLLDVHARELRAKSECFYTIGSSGHEAMAAVALATRPSDPALLHYRDCAFYIQRAKQVHGFPYLYNLLQSFTASAQDPISGGRHKVLGSKELCIPPQTSTISSHLPKAVGLALSIPRSKTLAIESEFPKDAITICSFGDASYNHSTALGAINCSQWIAYQNIPIPVLWVCEDNDKGISVPTPENWIQQSASGRPALKYFHCDGKNIVEVYKTTKAAADYIRTNKKPAFLHIKTVRLFGHAGSDIEQSYLNLRDIENNEKEDPVNYYAANLLAHGILNADDIVNLYLSQKARIEAIAKKVCQQKKLETIEQISNTITNKKILKKAPQAIVQPKDQQERPQTLSKIINWTLHDLMKQYPNTLVFGEDVAKKGGVYHVTANLQRIYGPKRVFNSLLDEQSILGTAIGFAQNGFIPIPEIQFLAYVHNAEDQIRGEAATLSFFSNKKFQNPMVIRIAGLAYQKGFGGHYHNDNSIAVFRDLPGITLACPSRPSDAAKMLRACVKTAYETGQVFIFLEPIALYNTRDLASKGDEAWCDLYPDVHETISPGEIGYFPADKDHLIISYGNGFYLSRQAVETHKKELGIIPSFIDLRWLAPLPHQEIVKVAKKYKKILIVDECRKTGSVSEELMSRLYENTEDIKMKRVCGADCFIPLGTAANKALVQPEDIARAFKELQELK